MARTLSRAATGRSLLDEPRPGAPRSISDAQVEDVIIQTLETMPDNSTHWSTRLMARKTGLSQSAVVRIWRAFGLQPHRVENFKFSTDPQFVEKVRDIVGLYVVPHRNMLPERRCHSVGQSRREAGRPWTRNSVRDYAGPN